MCLRDFHNIIIGTKSEMKNYSLHRYYKSCIKSIQTNLLYTRHK